MLAWVMLLANVFWSVAYDTEYAMVDRDDDIKIGIRTSALTFGRFDVAAIMLCYAVTLAIYVCIGVTLGFGVLYWLGWAAAVGCAIYHYTLIRNRERMACFTAFRHNNWLGGALFAGIAAHYAAASFCVLCKAVPMLAAPVCRLPDTRLQLAQLVAHFLRARIGGEHAAHDRILDARCVERR